MQKLLKGDDFYRIRVPSNVLNLPGREYVVSSVKAVSLELMCLKVSALMCIVCTFEISKGRHSFWCRQSHSVETVEILDLLSSL